MNQEIMIVAAEASSALYARRLLELINSESLKISAFGIGDRSMEALGFDCIGRSEEMAVVGIQEVLAHWNVIKGTFDQLLIECQKRKPKVALLLDYPDFNLRLAKKLKAMGIPVIYYISPQVWAWRQSRVKTIREVVDKVLVLFPFEKDFYLKHNVEVDFVGHPVLDELNDRYFDQSPDSGYLYQHRARYGITPYETLVGFMPGSRNSELKHHLQLQLDVARKLYLQNPSLKLALFVAPSFNLEKFKQQMPQIDFPLMVIQDDPLEMIHLADVILTASGTATLFVGLMEKPLVIMYKMNAITAQLAKWFVRSTKYFGMINLVLDEKVAPEFFQEQASVENLSASLNEFIMHPERREEVKLKLRQARTKLGHRGATKRVLASLSPYFEGLSDKV